MFLTPFPPEADFIIEGRPVVDHELTFKVTFAYDIDGTITSYSWDFGDGTDAEGKIATHVYSEKGEYIVILTVTDNDGLSTQIKKTIKISPLRIKTAKESGCLITTSLSGGIIYLSLAIFFISFIRFLRR
jgi:PKD repeat protein